MGEHIIKMPDVGEGIAEAELVRVIAGALGRDVSVSTDTGDGVQTAGTPERRGSAPLTGRQRAAVLGLVAQLDDD